MNEIKTVIEGVNNRVNRSVSETEDRNFETNQFEE